MILGPEGGTRGDLQKPTEQTG